MLLKISETIIHPETMLPLLVEGETLSPERLQVAIIAGVDYILVNCLVEGKTLNMKLDILGISKLEDWGG